MTDEIKIKKEKMCDDDPDDVVPPPTKKQPVLQLPAPTDKNLYNEITISGDEIERLKKQASADVPDFEKIAYHNASLSQIEGAIRKAVKNKEKKLFIGKIQLCMENKEPWKHKILSDITAKLVKKKVKSEFDDDVCCFEAFFS